MKKKIFAIVLLICVLCFACATAQKFEDQYGCVNFGSFGEREALTGYLSANEIGYNYAITCYTQGKPSRLWMIQLDNKDRLSEMRKADYIDGVLYSEADYTADGAAALFQYLSDGVTLDYTIYNYGGSNKCYAEFYDYGVVSYTENYPISHMKDYGLGFRKMYLTSSANNDSWSVMADNKPVFTVTLSDAGDVQIEDYLDRMTLSYIEGEDFYVQANWDTGIYYYCYQDGTVLEK